MPATQVTMPSAEDEDRLARMAENRRKMAEMGLLKQATILQTFTQVKRPPMATADPKIVKARSKPPKPRARAEPRRSARISGGDVDYMEIDEHDRPVGRVQHLTKGEEPEDPEELVDLMDREGRYNNAGQVIAPVQPSEEAWQAIQEVRCNSQGRGSVYDSVAGITCHFCRQKKLCGEEGCPRCTSRDASKECIGKTACTRCAGATGFFCRACLLIRYGQKLEDARQEMEEGSWLCPHCFEEEHPDDGWICNSSICMKRRGLKPTGIAIFDAQQRGFKSVAHLLQDQLKKRGVSKVLGGEEGSSQPQEAAAAAAPQQQPAGSSGSGAGSQDASDTQVPVSGSQGAAQEEARDTASGASRQGAAAAVAKPSPKRRGRPRKDEQQQQKEASPARRSARLSSAS